MLSEALQSRSVNFWEVAFNLGRKRAIRDMCQGTPLLPDLLKYGGAIITERGGALAHLAVVGRELNLRLVRMENARKLYPAGIEVAVDCDKGQINVSKSAFRSLL